MLTRFFASLSALVLLWTPSAFAQEFPLTIHHAKGETEVAAPAKRVVVFSEEFIETAVALEVPLVAVGLWRAPKCRTARMPGCPISIGPLSGTRPPSRSTRRWRPSSWPILRLLRSSPSATTSALRWSAERWARQAPRASPSTVGQICRAEGGKQAVCRPA